MTTDKKALDTLLSTLAPLLEKAESQFTPTGDETCDATLTFKNISQKDWLLLEDQLKAFQQGEGVASVEPSNQTNAFSQYFKEIKDCPMYKPKNPALAISHVAKLHGLDVAELRKAFKNVN